MLSIWTSLKLCCLVMSQENFRLVQTEVFADDKINANEKLKRTLWARQ